MRSIQRNPCPSIMWPMKVRRNETSQGKVSSCENSTTKECSKAMAATTFNGLLTNRIRQKQNTIIAQRASPVSLGRAWTRRDSSPKGISTTRPRREYNSLLRITGYLFAPSRSILSSVSWSIS